MIWRCHATAFIIAMVVAGRAHSRHLDRLDDLHAQGLLNNEGFLSNQGLLDKQDFLNHQGRNQIISTIQKCCMIAGWLALAFIAYATLSPLDARPVLVADIRFEHFAAFALLGLALGLAYPDRVVLVIVLVAGSAVMLEAMQLLTPDRHGRLLDAAVKVAGGICGIGAGQLASLLLRRQIARTK